MSKRDSNQTQQMTHAWMNECGTKLEPMQCDVISTKNCAGKVRDTNNKEGSLTTKELQRIMPSCRLASELRSQIPKCLSLLHPLLNLSFCVCTGIPIHLLSMHRTYSLLICTRIPCRGSHCLNRFIVRKMDV